MSLLDYYKDQGREGEILLPLISQALNFRIENKYFILVQKKPKTYTTTQEKGRCISNLDRVVKKKNTKRLEGRIWWPTYNSEFIPSLPFPCTLVSLKKTYIANGTIKHEEHLEICSPANQLSLRTWFLSCCPSFSLQVNLVTWPIKRKSQKRNFTLLLITILSYSKS